MSRPASRAVPRIRVYAHEEKSHQPNTSTAHYTSNFARAYGKKCTHARRTANKEASTPGMCPKDKRVRRPAGEGNPMPVVSSVKREKEKEVCSREKRPGPRNIHARE